MTERGPAEVKAPDPEIRKILDERARELSETPQSEEQAEDYIEIVEFVLSYEKYAIESSYISEVYPMHEFTTIPGVPPFVLGIINLRGNLLSVIDIRRFFDLPVKGISNLNRVVVIRTPRMEIGILADFILGVRNIPKRRIQQNLPTLTGIRAHYLKGVTEDRLVILNIEKILSDERIIIHQTVE
ncbi:purine-binding chemotaxis protein CheW [bacterium]|nr:purine-binding chemotaxis protein CheW [bacterium]